MNSAPDNQTPPTRRTKRRYADELYPSADEWQIRPLAIEVPHLYAMAIGYGVFGTNWFDLDLKTPEGAQLSTYRMLAMIQARQLALLADALANGMAGETAWMWAMERIDEDGSWTYERATEGYGIDPELIKPYPCGPERDHHDHYGDRDHRGWRNVIRIDCKASACPECTEEIPAPDPNQLALPFNENGERD